MISKIPVGRKEIAAEYGLSQAAGYLKRLLGVLLEDGLVEYMIREKPRSGLQKYRLTDKGCRLLGSLPGGTVKSISKKESKTKVKAG